MVQLFDEVYIHQEEMKLYEKRVVKFLDAFHKEFPLKEGMGIEEARNKLQLGSNTKVIDGILEILKRNKVIKEDKGVISNYRFKVIVKEDEDAMLREIIEGMANNFREKIFFSLEEPQNIYENISCT